MNRKTAAAFALTAMAISACSGPNRPMAANKGICTSFKAAQANANIPAGPVSAGADAAAPVEDCLRRWAYSLAPSADDANDVADAAVAACSAALSRWNQQGIAQQAANAQAGPVEALSLITGQATNPLAEHYSFAQSRALLYVVQARAGHCTPPPAQNGAPTGG